MLQPINPSNIKSSENIVENKSELPILPNELIKEIFNNLSLLDLNHVRTVHTAWNQFALEVMQKKIDQNLKDLENFLVKIEGEVLPAEAFKNLHILQDNSSYFLETGENQKLANRKLRDIMIFFLKNLSEPGQISLQKFMEERKDFFKKIELDSPSTIISLIYRGEKEMAVGEDDQIKQEIFNDLTGREFAPHASAHFIRFISKISNPIERLELFTHLRYKMLDFDRVSLIKTLKSYYESIEKKFFETIKEVDPNFPLAIFDQLEKDKPLGPQILNIVKENLLNTSLTEEEKELNLFIVTSLISMYASSRQEAQSIQQEVGNIIMLS